MKMNEMFRAGIWVRAAGETEKKFSQLRSTFSVHGWNAAKLRVVGLGSFHCYINGRRVSDELYLPLYTNFEARRDWPVGETLSGSRLYVPEYDILPYLREGENTLVIHYGGGWYTYDEEVPYGTAKAIWEIEAEDGAGEILLGSSDADRIGDSFVTDFALTRKERQDLSHPNSRAEAAEQDDGGWAHAAAAVPVDTEYEFSDCPADKAFDTGPAVLLKRTGDHAVYDWGRNASGYPVLRLTGKAGDTVRVIFSEERTDDGEPDARFGHEQELEYVCGGE